MAVRGEVLVVLRRLGFSVAGDPERYVVLQADDVGDSLDTVLVAPLDDVSPHHEDDPLAVRISAKEAGAPREQVVLPAHLSSIRMNRFEPHVVGRLSIKSLRAVQGVLSVLLALD